MVRSSRHADRALTSTERYPHVEVVRGAPALLAVGDVQGNGDALFDLLERTGYARREADGAMAWTGRDRVLLLLGDLVDGGTQPAEVLAAVTSLHGQARRAGGRVVVLRGNHEMMLLRALAMGALPTSGEKWFTEGGLDTLARLAAARGATIPDDVVSACFAPRLADFSELAPTIAPLLDLVRREYDEVLTFLDSETLSAALVNGCVLAVHAAPNFAAERVATFVETEAEVIDVAWARAWVRVWPADAAGLAARLAALKSRLDTEDGVCVRHIVFGHTPQDELMAPGFPKGRQYRVGRLIAPDAASGVPGLYNLLTVPREISPGGALGGLCFDADGVAAVYGRSPGENDGRWPERDPLGEADPAFVGGGL